MKKTVILRIRGQYWPSYILYILNYHVIFIFNGEVYHPFVHPHIPGHVWGNVYLLNAGNILWGLENRQF